MTKTKIFLLYLFFIHILLLVVFLKSDFIERVKGKLGFTPEFTVFYHNMTAVYNSMDANIPDKAVIFLGDSITQSLAVSAISPIAVNYGIGMDTSLGLLNRITNYASLNRASAIVIAIGTNDMKRRKNSQIVENYRKILAEMPAHVPIIISAILPVDEKLHKGVPNQRIQALNHQLKSLTLSKNINFLDITQKMIDENGNLDQAFHAGDGLHLNNNGYQIWIDALRNALNTT